MKRNRLTKVSAVLATALMAASITGMTTSAGNMKSSEAVRGGRTARSASRSTRTSKRAKGGNSGSSIEQTEADEILALQGKKAQVGEIVEIPLIMYTNNRCTCYDLLIEYDSRLEFVSVEGARSSYDFEDSGRKFVSIVGYEDEPYKDGEAFAVIKLKIPEGAENDDYDIRFSQVTSFSNNYEDFENYETKNTYIRVTGGVEKTRGTNIKLTDNVGMAGSSAVVQVVPTTNNKCSSYDLLIEYDSRLTIENKDVAGASTFCIFEENGKSYVSLVGYKNGIYADGEAAAAINFHIPENASSNDIYEVKFAEIKSFSGEFSDFENYTSSDAMISIVESERPGDKYSEYKLFQKFGPDGKLIFSKVGFRGDANNDGKTDVRDAAAVAKYCAVKNSGKKDIDEMGEFFGDVDEDGKLNIRDAAKIARYIAKGKVSWDDILK